MFLRFLLSLVCLPLLSNVTRADDGLIGQWSLTASQWKAKAFTPQQGTLSASTSQSVTFSKEAPAAMQFSGKFGKADVLRITDDLTLLPKESISAEAWVKVDQGMDWGGLIGAIQDNGSYERGWLLGFRGNKFCWAVTSQKTNVLTYMTASESFQLGAWYHVVGTYNGSEMKLYVDGKLSASSKAQSGPISYPPKTSCVIGSYLDDNEHYALNGQLERVTLWNRSLSPDEVQQLFVSRKSKFPGIDPASVTQTDWPTYLRDNQRTGITTEELSFPLHLQWVRESAQVPQPAWPAPANQDFWHKKTNLKARVIYDRAFHLVSVGSRVFYGSSADDKVYCVDANTGAELWSFYTEGPVRLAPTVAGDRLLFGSDDGHVYCVKTADGSLVWKQRIAPEEQQPRRIPGNERIISLWPVRTGVLVEDNIAYVCAGLFPQQGVYQAALELDSGKVIARGQLQVSAQGYLERRSGKLYVATGRDPAGAYVAKLQRRGKTIGKPVNSFSKDYPYSFIGTQQVRIGGGEGKIAAFGSKDGTQLWSAEIKGRAYSMIISGGKLLVSTDAGMIYCFGPQQPTELVTLKPKVQPGESPGRVVSQAKQLLSQSQTRKGYALVLGSGDGALLAELALQSELQIIGVEADANLVAQSRGLIEKHGLAGRVSVHHRSPQGTLPYTNYIFNFIVDHNSKVEKSELTRVLRPGGGVAVASTGELILARKPLTGVGEWTHMYANPSNTVCSQDHHVTGNMKLQWFGRPGPQQMIDRHHRTIAPLWKSGRLFIPGNNRVIGVDAYNGTRLWNVEVPDSRRVAAYRDCSYLVATEDRVYVAAKNRCLALDALTGEERESFPVPLANHEWGYVAVVNDWLIGSTTRPGGIRRGHSMETIREGTYWDFRPLVCSDSLFVTDRKQPSLKWQYEPKGGVIINSTITVGDNTIFFVESSNPASLQSKDGRVAPEELLAQGSSLVALNLQTGKEQWREAGNFDSIQHTIYGAYADGKLVIVGSKNSGKNRLLSKVLYDVNVFDAKSGKLVWSETQNQGTRIGGDHGEQDHHPVIVGNKLYCEPFAYDLHTGKPLDDWGWKKSHRRGCGTISASASTFFFRQSNPQMFDLETNTYSPVTTSTRPGCWINMIPAGGLLLIPEASSGCTCNYAIQTSLAFLPVPDGER